MPLAFTTGPCMPHMVPSTARMRRGVRSGGRRRTARFPAPHGCPLRRPRTVTHFRCAPRGRGKRIHHRYLPSDPAPGGPGATRTIAWRGIVNGQRTLRGSFSGNLTSRRSFAGSLTSQRSQSLTCATRPRAPNPPLGHLWGYQPGDWQHALLGGSRDGGRPLVFRGPTAWWVSLPFRWRCLLSSRRGEASFDAGSFCERGLPWWR